MVDISLGTFNNSGSQINLWYEHGSSATSSAYKQTFKVVGTGSYNLKYIDVPSYVKLYSVRDEDEIFWSINKNNDDSIVAGPYEVYGNVTQTDDIVITNVSRLIIPGGVILDNETKYYLHLYTTASNLIKPGLVVSGDTITDWQAFYWNTSLSTPAWTAAGFAFGMNLFAMKIVYETYTLGIDYATFTFYDTLIKNITVDGFVLERGTKAFTVDGIVDLGAATLAKTFVLDGYVRGTFAKTFTVDAIIKESKEKQLILDGIIKVTKTKTFTIDSIIKETLSCTTTIDGIVHATNIKTFTLDGRIKLDTSALFSIDGIVKDTKEKSITIDGQIIEHKATEITLNAVVKEVNTKEFPVDSIVSARLIKQFTVDAAVRQTFEETLDLDGIVVDRRYEALYIDGYIRGTSVKTVTLDGIVLTQSRINFTVDGIIRFDVSGLTGSAKWQELNGKANIEELEGSARWQELVGKANLG